MTGMWEACLNLIEGGLWLIPTVLGGISLMPTLVPEARLRALQRKLQNIDEQVDIIFKEEFRRRGGFLFNILLILLVIPALLIMATALVPVLVLLKLFQLGRIFRVLNEVSVLFLVFPPLLLWSMLIGFIVLLPLIVAGIAVSIAIWTVEGLTRRRVIQTLSCISFIGGLLLRLVFSIG